MTEEGLNKVYTTLGASNHTKEKREKEDYYATHPSAINDLFNVEDFSNKIWECACGEGHLSERIKEFDKEVYSTDLINRGYGDDFFNFLKSNIKWSGDIITNPPYKYAKEFVLKALKSISKGNKVAMFMKLTFLESNDRVELFKKFPPKRVWVYSYRKPVARGGDSEMFNKSSAICYAWFIWEKGYYGSPNLSWITKQGKIDFGGE